MIILSEKGTFNEINKINMKRSEETWWTIKFLKYYDSKYSFSSGVLSNCCSTQLDGTLFSIRDKEILIKRKCHQARCVTLVGVSSCRRHLSVLIEISRNEVFFLFILLRFTRNPSSLSVMFYVFARVVQTRQLVLTCALALMPRTLKQLLWYKVALIMKWDAAAWRNLDLEKSFFMKKII